MFGKFSFVVFCHRHRHLQDKAKDCSEHKYSIHHILQKPLAPFQLMSFFHKLLFEIRQEKQADCIDSRAPHVYTDGCAGDLSNVSQQTTCFPPLPGRLRAVFCGPTFAISDDTRYLGAPSMVGGFLFVGL